MGQSPFENPIYTTSDAALEALRDGDVQALLDLHKSIFSGFRMADDGDGDDGGDEGDGDDGSGDGDDGDEGDGDGGEDGSQSKGKRQDPKLKELHDENSRRRNENKSLRKSNEDLAARLKKFEDADKSETEKITGERDELKTKVDTLSGENTQLKLRVAFLENNTTSWHNPKAALRLLELDGVEIDDEGKVTGMDEAIKKLAKDNPYLVKKGDGDEGDGESGAPQQKSGSPVSSKGKNAQREALEKKYRLGSS